jgi:hypothetical protein
MSERVQLEEKRRLNMGPVIDVTTEEQELIQKTEVMAAELQDFSISNQQDYTKAGEHLKSIKNSVAELDELRKSLTRPLDDSKKRIMDLFRNPLDVLSKAEAAIKRGMLGYQQDQERIRRAEEARLAELQRKEAERIAKRAEKADANGNADKAEALRDQAQQLASVTPLVATKVEPVAGINTKTVWKYRIVDVNIIPREYMVANDKMIGDVARANKGTLKIAGVEFYPEQVIAAGR